MSELDAGGVGGGGSTDSSTTEDEEEQDRRRVTRSRSRGEASTVDSTESDAVSEPSPNTSRASQTGQAPTRGEVESNTTSQRSASTSRASRSGQAPTRGEQTSGLQAAEEIGGDATNSFDRELQVGEQTERVRDDVIGQLERQGVDADDVDVDVQRTGNRFEASVTPRRNTEEQFGDIDFSLGLGDPDVDEVERFIDDRIGEGGSEFVRDNFSDPVREFGEGLRNSDPFGPGPEQSATVRALNGDYEPIPNPSRENTAGNDNNVGIEEALGTALIASGNIAEEAPRLPGAVLEGVEGVDFLLESTPIAGGSEEQFNERVGESGDFASAVVQSEAQRAASNPDVFAAEGLLTFGAGRALSASRLTPNSRGVLDGSSARTTVDTFTPDGDTVGNIRSRASTPDLESSLSNIRSRTPEVSVRREPDSGMVEIDPVLKQQIMQKTNLNLGSDVSFPSLRGRGSLGSGARIPDLDDFVEGARTRASDSATQARNVVSDGAQTVQDAAIRVRNTPGEAARDVAQEAANVRRRASNARQRAGAEVSRGVEAVSERRQRFTAPGFSDIRAAATPDSLDFSLDQAARQAGRRFELRKQEAQLRVLSADARARNAVSTRVEAVEDAATRVKNAPSVAARNVAQDAARVRRRARSAKAQAEFELSRGTEFISDTRQRLTAPGFSDIRSAATPEILDFSLDEAARKAGRNFERRRQQTALELSAADASARESVSALTDGIPTRRDLSESAFRKRSRASSALTSARVGAELSLRTAELPSLPNPGSSVPDVSVPTINNPLSGVSDLTLRIDAPSATRRKSGLSRDGFDLDEVFNDNDADIDIDLDDDADVATTNMQPIDSDGPTRGAEQKLLTVQTQREPETVPDVDAPTTSRNANSGLGGLGTGLLSTEAGEGIADVTIPATFDVPTTSSGTTSPTAPEPVLEPTGPPSSSGVPDVQTPGETVPEPGVGTLNDVDDIVSVTSGTIVGEESGVGTVSTPDTKIGPTNVPKVEVGPFTETPPKLGTGQPAALDTPAVSRGLSPSPTPRGRTRPLPSFDLNPDTGKKKRRRRSFGSFNKTFESDVATADEVLGGDDKADEKLFEGL